MIKTKFLSNLLLSLVWIAITGAFTFENFLFGFALSFFLLWVTATDRRDNKYFNRIPKLLAFVFFFLYELIKANIEVAYDVVTPKHYMKPGIVKIPLDAKSDLEITLLANLISLTPGTLSLDVSDDRKVLYVHAMYVKDREDFVAGIKSGFERRLLEITR
ncbi:Na+/H+ antiporter subunit E [Algoriphagus sp. AGSA1]|uniref:Na+/H+ antiporter subunit E n=1 Tax=Algoriphagus sp. AGSA1 TaxID=2907213 RepID=UPI001F45F681|nr:Na+/H+ antiporter subunit E [Algoriphagus sp. AGSA1]MCE7056002.1 Na+/H+ antiporter subunit E [Algoriphagus sp. AGSA1]